jgi:phosphodiesterase/alkaline phosphatase D-like protein
MTNRFSFDETASPKRSADAQHHHAHRVHHARIAEASAFLGFDATTFPNGISSGDVTQDSAVLWTRTAETGHLIFQIATDASFSHVVRTRHLNVTDPMVPVKAEFDHLKAGEQYYYRAIDASGDVIEGTFETASEFGSHDGFHVGVGGDNFGELAPYVGLANAASAGLEVFIKLGDTIYADLAYQGGTFVPTVTTTLAEFQDKHDTVYSEHLGVNYWADLQATTPILSMIDDHEVIDDFAGGEHPDSDPRFTGQPGDFINETPLFKTGLKAFNQYNAIEERTYQGTEEDLFDGTSDLYRYNTYGSDAAIIMLDARSYRDEEIPAPQNPLSPAEIGQFLVGSFDPDRTMLGDAQLERLEQDLLDARDNGLTWKFVMLPEAIQNFGPVIGPGDRYEGYAAERTALLKFIESNHIENVVFVSSDTHWTSVNNLTYQDFAGGPQIATSVFEVNTLAVASIPIAPFVPAVAAEAGLISQAQLDFYTLLLPVAPDTDSALNDKDDFVKFILNSYMTTLGYDPIGLESGGPIDATLISGDYFVGHNFGWTDFNIDATTGKLMVTTWGVPLYTDLDVANNAVLGFTPTIVSQFEVTPTSNSIIGTDHNDHLVGTDDADVILGAAGNDQVKGGNGDDYLDGSKGNDFIAGGDGADEIFGRNGNDFLKGGDGADRLEGGNGNDKASGGDGDDVFVAANGDGNDHYSGDQGTDTLDLSATSAPVKVDLEGGTASGSAIGFDRLSSVENVIGSGGGDHIAGDNDANRLEGGAGNDKIAGDRGNDVIIGGSGDDLLRGGPGDDTFIFHAEFGTDTITDFSAGPGIGDVIQFDQTMLADFAAMLLATSDLGDDLRITSGADAIILKNVADVANLNADDFDFV